MIYKKTLCFDLDGVICNTKKNFYKKSKPKISTIRFINKLYNKGYFIKIYTARYMGRNNDNIIKAKKAGFKFTEKQLKNWNLKYHKLIVGKTSYDYIVDDKSIGFDKNWKTELKNKLGFKK